MTGYERIIKNGLKDISDNLVKKDKIAKAEELVKFLNEFEVLGVMPYFSVNSKDSLKKSVDKVFKDYSGYARNNNISNEIYEASKDIDIPPFILQNLVDFFDKDSGILLYEKAFHRPFQTLQNKDRLHQSSKEV